MRSSDSLWLLKLPGPTDDRGGIARFGITGGGMDPLAPADAALAIGIEARGLVEVAVTVAAAGAGPASADSFDPRETILARLALAAVALVIDSDLADRTVYGGLGLIVVAAVVEARAPNGRGTLVVVLLPIEGLSVLVEGFGLTVLVVPVVGVGLETDAARGGLAVVVVVVVDLFKVETGLVEVAVLAVAAAMLDRGAGLAIVGRAEGTGGFVVTFVRVGGDFGLESITYQQPITSMGETGGTLDSLPKTPDLRTFLTPSIFCPILPSFPNVLLALFSLSLPLTLVV